jgi:hypothetical protein
VQEAKNFTNIEISKIINWAKDNKITFNKQKSKVMLVTRRKRREKPKYIYIPEQQTSRTGQQYKIPRNHNRQHIKL